jgi:hypothetical protein
MITKPLEPLQKKFYETAGLVVDGMAESMNILLVPQRYAADDYRR